MLLFNKSKLRHLLVLTATSTILPSYATVVDTEEKYNGNQQLSLDLRKLGYPWEPIEYHALLNLDINVFYRRKNFIAENNTAGANKNDSNGKIKLKDALRDSKIAILVFSATWCQHCTAAVTALDSFAKKMLENFASQMKQTDSGAKVAKTNSSSKPGQIVPGLETKKTNSVIHTIIIDISTEDLADVDVEEVRAKYYQYDNIDYVYAASSSATAGLFAAIPTFVVLDIANERAMKCTGRVDFSHLEQILKKYDKNELTYHF
jgi:thiol-disulfide isomerase/thioredoxin